MKSNPDVFLVFSQRVSPVGVSWAGITVTGTGSGQLSVSGPGSTLSSEWASSTITTGNHLSASLGEILHPGPESRSVSLLSRRYIITSQHPDMYRPWMLNQNVPLTRDLFIRNVEPDPWLPPGSWESWGWAGQTGDIWYHSDTETHEPSDAAKISRHIVTNGLWYPDRAHLAKLQTMQSYAQHLQWPGLSISVRNISGLLWQGLSRVHTSAGCADHLLISREPVWRPPDTRGAGHSDVKIPGNHNTQHNLHWSRVTGWMDWLLFIAATVNTILHIPWTPGNIPIDSFSFYGSKTRGHSANSELKYLMIWT